MGAISLWDLGCGCGLVDRAAHSSLYDLSSIPLGEQRKINKKRGWAWPFKKSLFNSKLDLNPAKRMSHNIRLEKTMAYTRKGIFYLKPSQIRHPDRIPQMTRLDPRPLSISSLLVSSFITSSAMCTNLVKSEFHYST